MDIKLFLVFLTLFQTISSADSWLPASDKDWNEYGTDICSVRRVRHEDITPEKFSELTDKPFIITFSEGAKAWVDSSKWTIPELKERYQEWNVSSGKAIDIVYRGGQGYINTTWQDFINGMRNGNGIKDPTYLFDRSFYWNSDLHKSVYPPSYLPKVGDSILFVGGSGTGATFHKHMPAWNGVVFGMKRWFLYPVEKTPPGGMYAYTSDAWLKYVYPKLKEEDKPIECIQKAGEILYVPESMYHAILNIGETVAISIQEVVVYSEVEQLFYKAINSHYNSTTVSDASAAERYKNISEDAYEELHFMFPDNVEILEHLSELACYEEASPRCIALLHLIVKKDPFAIETKKLLSKLLYDWGEYDEGIELLEEALQQNPQSKSLLREYGDFLYEIKSDKAKSAYETLLANVDPDSEDGQEVRKILRNQYGWIDDHMKPKGPPNFHTEL